MRDEWGLIVFCQETPNERTETVRFSKSHVGLFYFIISLASNAFPRDLKVDLKRDSTRKGIDSIPTILTCNSFCYSGFSWKIPVWSMKRFLRPIIARVFTSQSSLTFLPSQNTRSITNFQNYNYSKLLWLLYLKQISLALVFLKLFSKIYSSRSFKNHDRNVWRRLQINRSISIRKDNPERNLVFCFISFSFFFFFFLEERITSNYLRFISQYFQEYLRFSFKNDNRDRKRKNIIRQKKFVSVKKEIFFVSLQFFRNYPTEIYLLISSRAHSNSKNYKQRLQTENSRCIYQKQFASGKKEI